MITYKQSELGPSKDFVSFPLQVVLSKKLSSSFFGGNEALLCSKLGFCSPLLPPLPPYMKNLRCPTCTRAHLERIYKALVYVHIGSTNLYAHRNFLKTKIHFSLCANPRKTPRFGRRKTVLCYLTTNILFLTFSGDIFNVPLKNISILPG